MVRRRLRSDAFLKRERRGTAVALRGCMSKIRKTESGAPQNAGGIMVAEIDHDLVSQRAYERYLARGKEDGQDVDDWLKAERELRERNPSDQEP